MKSQNLFLKSTAFFTAFFYLITTLGSEAAAGTLSFSPEIRVPSSFNLSLPETMGSVETVHSGTGPALIHIQEAHGNLEAQQNIRQILHHLKDHYGVKLVLLEGNTSPLKPSLARFVPEDMPLTLKVLENLMQQSVATGPELFLAKEEDAKAYGIENPEAYIQNSASFKEVLIQKQKTDGFLKDLDLQIGRLTGPYLNSNLRNFLKRLESFEAGITPWMDWLSFVQKEAEAHLKINLKDAGTQFEWPMLVRLFKLQEWEQAMDAAALVDEKQKFLKVVKPKISKEIYAEISKLFEETLSQSSLPDPQTRQLFETLVSHLPANFDYKAYPNLNRFIGHLILQSELKTEALLKEIHLLTEKTADQFAATPEEKQIVALTRDYGLLKKLFSLELTPAEFNQIQTRPSEMIKKFEKVNAASRVKNIEFKHLMEIDALYEKAMGFYGGAKARDAYLIENVERVMKETGEPKAVVITGGFHAQPFKEHFQSKNYNYALISPRLTQMEKMSQGRGVYVENFLRDFQKSNSSTIGDSQKIITPRFELRALGRNPDFVRRAVAAELIASGIAPQATEYMQQFSPRFRSEGGRQKKKKIKTEKTEIPAPKPEKLSKPTKISMRSIFWGAGIFGAFFFGIAGFVARKETLRMQQEIEKRESQLQQETAELAKLNSMKQRMIDEIGVLIQDPVLNPDLQEMLREFKKTAQEHNPMTMFPEDMYVLADSSGRFDPSIFSLLENGDPKLRVLFQMILIKEAAQGRPYRESFYGVSERYLNERWHEELPSFPPNLHERKKIDLVDFTHDLIQKNPGIVDLSKMRFTSWIELDAFGYFYAFEYAQKKGLTDKASLENLRTKYSDSKFVDTLLTAIERTKEGRAGLYEYIAKQFVKNYFSGRHISEDLLMDRYSLPIQVIAQEEFAKKGREVFDINIEELMLSYRFVSDPQYSFAESLKPFFLKGEVGLVDDTYDTIYSSTLKGKERLKNLLSQKLKALNRARPESREDIAKAKLVAFLKARPVGESKQEKMDLLEEIWPEQDLEEFTPAKASALIYTAEKLLFTEVVRFYEKLPPDLTGPEKAKRLFVQFDLEILDGVMKYFEGYLESSLLPSVTLLKLDLLAAGDITLRLRNIDYLFIMLKTSEKTEVRRSAAYAIGRILTDHLDQVKLLPQQNLLSYLYPGATYENYREFYYAAHKGEFTGNLTLALRKATEAEERRVIQEAITKIETYRAEARNEPRKFNLPEKLRAMPKNKIPDPWNLEYVWSARKRLAEREIPDVLKDLFRNPQNAEWGTNFGPRTWPDLMTHAIHSRPVSTAYFDNWPSDQMGNLLEWAAWKKAGISSDTRTGRDLAALLATRPLAFGFTVRPDLYVLHVLTTLLQDEDMRRDYLRIVTALLEMSAEAFQRRSNFSESFKGHEELDATSLVYIERRGFLEKFLKDEKIAEAQYDQIQELRNKIQFYRSISKFFPTELYWRTAKKTIEAAPRAILKLRKRGEWTQEELDYVYQMLAAAKAQEIESADTIWEQFRAAFLVYEKEWREDQDNKSAEIKRIEGLVKKILKATDLEQLKAEIQKGSPSFWSASVTEEIKAVKKDAVAAVNAEQQKRYDALRSDEDDEIEAGTIEAINALAAKVPKSRNLKKLEKDVRAAAASAKVNTYYQEADEAIAAVKEEALQKIREERASREKSLAEEIIRQLQELTAKISARTNLGSLREKINGVKTWFSDHEQSEKVKKAKSQALVAIKKEQRRRENKVRQQNDEKVQAQAIGEINRLAKQIPEHQDLVQLESQIRAAVKVYFYFSGARGVINAVRDAAIGKIEAERNRRKKQGDDAGKEQYVQELNRLAAQIPARQDLEQLKEEIRAVRIPFFYLDDNRIDAVRYRFEKIQEVNDAIGQRERLQVDEELEKFRIKFEAMSAKEIALNRLLLGVTITEIFNGKPRDLLPKMEAVGNEYSALIVQKTEAYLRERIPQLEEEFQGIQSRLYAGADPQKVRERFEPLNTEAGEIRQMVKELFEGEGSFAKSTNLRLKMGSEALLYWEKLDEALSYLEEIRKETDDANYRKALLNVYQTWDGHPPRSEKVSPPAESSYEGKTVSLFDLELIERTQNSELLLRQPIISLGITPKEEMKIKYYGYKTIGDLLHMTEEAAADLKKIIPARIEIFEAKLKELAWLNTPLKDAKTGWRKNTLEEMQAMEILRVGDLFDASPENEAHTERIQKFLSAQSKEKVFNISPDELQTPLHELNLAIPGNLLLWNAGIQTIGQVAALSLAELEHLGLFEVVSPDELRLALFHKGLRVGDPKAQKEESKASPKTFHAMEEDPEQPFNPEVYSPEIQRRIDHYYYMARYLSEQLVGVPFELSLKEFRQEISLIVGKKKKLQVDYSAVGYLSKYWKLFEANLSHGDLDQLFAYIRDRIDGPSPERFKNQLILPPQSLRDSLNQFIDGGLLHRIGTAIQAQRSNAPKSLSKSAERVMSFKDSPEAKDYLDADDLFKVLGRYLTYREVEILKKHFGFYSRTGGFFEVLGFNNDYAEEGYVAQSLHTLEKQKKQDPDLQDFYEKSYLAKSILNPSVLEKKTPEAFSPFETLPFPRREKPLSPKEEETLTAWMQDKLVRAAVATNNPARRRQIVLGILEGKADDVIAFQTKIKAEKIQEVRDKIERRVRWALTLNQFGSYGSPEQVREQMIRLMRETELERLLRHAHMEKIAALPSMDTETLRDIILQLYPDKFSPAQIETVVKAHFQELFTVTRRRGIQRAANVLEDLREFVVALEGDQVRRRRSVLKRLLIESYYPLITRDAQGNGDEARRALEQAILSAKDPEWQQLLESLQDFYREALAYQPFGLKEQIEGRDEPFRPAQKFMIYEQTKIMTESPEHSVINTSHARVGKTAPAVLSFFNLKDPEGKFLVNKVVYTTSKAALYEVGHELEKRLDKEALGLQVFVLDGISRKEKEAIIKKASEAQGRVVLVVNYDSHFHYKEALSEFKADGHAIDEMENLRRGHQAKRRALPVLEFSTPYRMAISARLVVNRPEDVIYALLWLRPHELNPSALPLKQAAKVLKQLSKDQLFEYLDQVTVRWRRAVVFPELQPVTERIVIVPYSPLQEEIIRKMRADFSGWKKTEARPDKKSKADHLFRRFDMERRASVDARLVLPKKDTKDKTLEELTPKLLKAEQIVAKKRREHGKILILVDFPEESKYMVQHFDRLYGKGSAVAITNDLSLLERDERIQKFRGDPESTHILVGTTYLLGSSLNLFQLPGSSFHNSTLIRMSRPWYNSDDGDRLTGFGQDHPVEVITLISQSQHLTTIEEHLEKILSGKKEIFRHVIEGKPFLDPRSSKRVESFAKELLQSLQPQQQEEIPEQSTAQPRLENRALVNSQGVRLNVNGAAAILGADGTPFQKQVIVPEAKTDPRLAQFSERGREILRLIAKPELFIKREAEQQSGDLDYLIQNWYMLQELKVFQPPAQEFHLNGGIVSQNPGEVSLLKLSGPLSWDSLLNLAEKIHFRDFEKVWQVMTLAAPSVSKPMTDKNLDRFFKLAHQRGKQQAALTQEGIRQALRTARDLSPQTFKALTEVMRNKTAEVRLGKPNTLPGEMTFGIENEFAFSRKKDVDTDLPRQLETEFQTMFSELRRMGLLQDQPSETYHWQARAEGNFGHVEIKTPVIRNTAGDWDAWRQIFPVVRGKILEARGKNNAGVAQTLHIHVGFPGKMSAETSAALAFLVTAMNHWLNQFMDAPEDSAVIENFPAYYLAGAPLRNRRVDNTDLEVDYNPVFDTFEFHFFAPASLNVSDAVAIDAMQRKINIALALLNAAAQHPERFNLDAWGLPVVRGMGSMGGRRDFILRHALDQIYGTGADADTQGKEDFLSLVLAHTPPEPEIQTLKTQLDFEFFYDKTGSDKLFESHWEEQGWASHPDLSLNTKSLEWREFLAAESREAFKSKLSGLVHLAIHRSGPQARFARDAFDFLTSNFKLFYAPQQQEIISALARVAILAGPSIRTAALSFLNRLFGSEIKIEQQTQHLKHLGDEMATVAALAPEETARQAYQNLLQQMGMMEDSPLRLRTLLEAMSMDLSQSRSPEIWKNYLDQLLEKSHRAKPNLRDIYLYGIGVAAVWGRPEVSEDAHQRIRAILRSPDYSVFDKRDLLSAFELSLQHRIETNEAIFKLLGEIAFAEGDFDFLAPDSLENSSLRSHALRTIEHLILKTKWAKPFEKGLEILAQIARRPDMREPLRKQALDALMYIDSTAPEGYARSEELSKMKREHLEALLFDKDFEERFKIEIMKTIVADRKDLMTLGASRFFSKEALKEWQSAVLNPDLSEDYRMGALEMLGTVALTFDEEKKEISAKFFEEILLFLIQTALGAFSGIKIPLKVRETAFSELGRLASPDFGAYGLRTANFLSNVALGKSEKLAGVKAVRRWAVFELVMRSLGPLHNAVRGKAYPKDEQTLALLPVFEKVAENKIPDLDLPKGIQTYALSRIQQTAQTKRVSVAPLTRQKAKEIYERLTRDTNGIPPYHLYWAGHRDPEPGRVTVLTGRSVMVRFSLAVANKDITEDLLPETLHLHAIAHYGIGQKFEQQTESPLRLLKVVGRDADGNYILTGYFDIDKEVAQQAKEQQREVRFNIRVETEFDPEHPVWTDNEGKQDAGVMSFIEQGGLGQAYKPRLFNFLQLLHKHGALKEGWHTPDNIHWYEYHDHEALSIKERGPSASWISSLDEADLVRAIHIAMDIYRDRVAVWKLLDRLKQADPSAANKLEEIASDFEIPLMLEVREQAPRSEIRELYEKIYRDFAALQPREMNGKTVVFDPEKLAVARTNFEFVEGRWIPKTSRVHSFYITLEDKLSGFLDDAAEAVVKALPEGQAYYRSPKETFHISIFLPQDLRPGDLNAAQAVRLTPEELKGIKEKVRESLKQVGPYTIRFVGLRISAADGGVIAVFEDEGQTDQIRKQLAQAGSEVTPKVNSTKYPKVMIHVTLLRFLEDISPETLTKLKQVVEDYQTIAQQNTSETVRGLEFGHETRWMHTEFEPGSKEFFPLRSEMRPASLDPAKVFLKDPDFLNAVEYFNAMILQRASDGNLKPMTWNELVRIYEQIRGDLRNPRYFSFEREKRLSHSDKTWAKNWLERINALETDDSKVIESAASLYWDFSLDRETQPLALRSGFDKVKSISAADPKTWHPADGHHRLVWFLMNFFLLRNGYSPFYFQDEKEYWTMTADSFIKKEDLGRWEKLLLERVSRSDRDARGPESPLGPDGLRSEVRTEMRDAVQIVARVFTANIFSRGLATAWELFLQLVPQAAAAEVKIDSGQIHEAMAEFKLAPKTDGSAYIVGEGFALDEKYLGLPVLHQMYGNKLFVVVTKNAKQRAIIKRYNDEVLRPANKILIQTASHAEEAKRMTHAWLLQQDVEPGALEAVQAVVSIKEYNLARALKKALGEANVLDTVTERQLSNFVRNQSILNDLMSQFKTHFLTRIAA